MQITFDRKTVNTCLQQKFVLPTYQRDYKWEPKHLQELLNDIQEAFLTSHDPAHGRRDVLGYDPYFLGTIITTQVGQGAKAIVDGQQRITTLVLLLCYAHRLQAQQKDLDISPVDQSIRRKVAGQNEFNLEMDSARKHFFDLLIDSASDDEDLAAQVDSIPAKDNGTLQLWNIYQQIDTAIATDIKSNLMAKFFDYLTECVYLFEIGVPGEQDGHKVFVTMNDRGLKLSPIDLLKGFLLSSISTDNANQTAHAKWNESINKLRAIGSDEDSNFFKTWIRAKYASSSRGKKRGDAAGDFELIGDSYHRWMMDNKENIGLNNSDDFSELLTGTHPFYVDLYCKIKNAERTLTKDLAHVFYNGSRDLTLQSMVILSAVRRTDTSIEVTKKIDGISYYLDYLATVRYLNDKENTYDNIRDLMFELTKEVRNLDLSSLKTLLLAKIKSEKDLLDSLKKVSYGSIKRQDLLTLLARIADFLENSLGLSTKVGFAAYIDRTQDSRTFDIEHLIANDMPKVNSDLIANGKSAFSNISEFNEQRNSIGGLILLPRGRNRSMKDMVYSEKLARYSNENILAQTLTDSFYLNQPNWNTFSTNSGLIAKSLSHADSTTIDERSDFYFNVAKQIWNAEALEIKLT